MVGEGVIAESYVSFDITWKNPGEGKQPEWDQNKQAIELHSVDLYPDLMYSKASALATYYEYTSIDKILGVIKKINEIIEVKIQEKAKKNETLALPMATTAMNAITKVIKPELPAKIDSPIDPTTKLIKDADKITQDVKKPEEVGTKDKKTENNPDKPESTSPSYTVNVIGEKLKLIDILGKGAGYSEVLIKHRVSGNIVKQLDGEKLENSNKIKAIINVGGLLGTNLVMGFDEFNTEDGRNLLVEILPSIELRFTPGENAVIPRAEDSRIEDDWIIEFAKVMKDRRMQKEILAVNSTEKVKASENK